MIELSLFALLAIAAASALFGAIVGVGVMACMAMARSDED